MPFVNTTGMNIIVFVKAATKEMVKFAGKVSAVEKIAVK